MTQKQRVLRALQTVGTRGLTAVDFLAPNVCDGGAPITRVAARILELRADGHDITEHGRRDSCSVYVLRAAAVEPLEPAPDPLVLPVGTGTPYDRYGEAA